MVKIQRSCPVYASQGSTDGAWRAPKQIVPRGFQRRSHLQEPVRLERKSAQRLVPVPRATIQHSTLGGRRWIHAA
jgi:hypothetical protein